MSDKIVEMIIIHIGKMNQIKNILKLSTIELIISTNNDNDNNNDEERMKYKQLLAITKLKKKRKGRGKVIGPHPGRYIL